jgi:hypothetical protein
MKNMSSVQGYESCPRCGNLGQYIYYCTGKYYNSFRCHFCGFYHEIKGISEGPQEDFYDFFFSSEDDSEGPESAQMEEERIESAGAICLTDKDGFAQLTQRSPVGEADDEADMAKFKEVLLKNPELDPEKCYLTRWDPMKKEVTYLFGNPEKVWELELKDFKEGGPQE